MGPNDDLARWGEPPASEQEMKLARALAERLEQQTRGLPDGPEGELLEADSWLRMMVTTVLTHAGLTENAACLADPGGPPSAPPELRLRVQRLAAPGQYTLVGSTHPAPTTLRDLQRVPDDADRVRLRTGDRARIEVICDRDGYLTVFNVGPTGTFHLLWPDDPAGATVHPARSPLHVAHVVLTPPAGRERVYAVWSRVPLSREHLLHLGGPGVATRDMRRVQEAIDQMPPQDWHAVLLLLDHEA